MTAPDDAAPAARQRQPRVADDPRYPGFIRWDLKLTSLPRQIRVLRRMLISTAGPGLLSAEEAARLNPPLLEYLDECGRKLLSTGWLPFVLMANRASEALDSCTALTENPVDGSIGFVLVTQGRKSPRISGTVGFRTDFADGVRLLTSNSVASRRTPRMPRHELVRFPAVHDAAELYDIHRFRVAERARRVPTVFLTRGADPLQFQQRESAEAHAFWLKSGYFERAGDSVMRRTRRGAVLGALRALFPWKQITESREHRDAARILERYRKHSS